MWPCKNISHIQVLVTNFFPTPPIKLKLGLQVGGRLLIATQMDQPMQSINTTWLCLLDYSRAPPGLWKAVHLFRVPAVFQWIHWIQLMNLTQACMISQLNTPCPQIAGCNTPSSMTNPLALAKTLWWGPQQELNHFDQGAGYLTHGSTHQGESPFG
jgi:hypothetical protein